MKKSTKILIAATAVATVVSIGSVSYALWSAGAAQSKEVTGQTGAINTIGELTVTPSEASGSSLTSMNALYPVDQGTAYRTYWEFDVTVTGEGKQIVTVKGELTKAVDGTGSAALYYSATKPSGGEVSGAKQISGTDAEGNPITAQEITLAESGATKVYIYMTANNTDAMKANIKLTFEASAAAE